VPQSVEKSSVFSAQRWLALIEALRIPHWVKNVFVLAALAFSGKWNAPDWEHAWLMTLGAFFVFCLLSSAVYLFNDVVDRHSDRVHPAKASRPVASGRLPVSWALGAGVLLVAAAELLLAQMSMRLYDINQPFVGLGLLVYAGLYLLLHLGYNAGLRRRPILDVLIVAMGFVLRAMGGAAAISVRPSVWLVFCTFTLCLFIALAKRRSEIVALGETSRHTRVVNRFYSPTNLEHMLAVSAGLAIITYGLYCVDDRTIRHLGSANMIWTIPLVVYGMFRYYCLTLSTHQEDLTQAVYSDMVLWAVGLAWVVLVAMILVWGKQDWLHLLESGPIYPAP
jgi:4-hydroxybenzoate polyprenyltransferase